MARYHYILKAYSERLKGLMRDQFSLTKTSGAPGGLVINYHTLTEPSQAKSGFLRDLYSLPEIFKTLGDSYGTTTRSLTPLEISWFGWMT